MKLHNNDMLKLTQILQGGEEGWIEKPALVNPDYIQFVSTAKLERKGGVIIGQQYEKEVRRVQMRDGAFLFVTEQLGEIFPKTRA